MFPQNTEPTELNNVAVDIVSNYPVYLNGEQLNLIDGKYSFQADLLNNSETITINQKDYIVAAGIESWDRNLVSNPVTGYVSKALINGTPASITRKIMAGKCPGNIYYKQNPQNSLDWTAITYYISANQASAPAANAKLVYTIAGGVSDAEKTVNLSNGSQTVVLGDAEYTVNATFPSTSENEILITRDNFKIDFQELRDYKNAGGTLNDGYSWDVIDQQLEEIEFALDEWYGTAPTYIVEEDSCMDVLQSFLNFAVEGGYFTVGDTDNYAGCTYVEYINGLSPFTLSNGLDGWMYSDAPVGDDPTQWYTAPIGAADYPMDVDTTIAWFFTADYTKHPW